jgi:hypothetical protein
LVETFVAQDDGYFGHTQLTGGLEAQMAVHHQAVAARQHRALKFKANFPHAAAHVIYRVIVIVLARVRAEKISRSIGQY